MALQKAPKEIHSNTLTLEEEMQIFAEEIRNYFSKEELEEIAREVGFVQRKGKLEAWHFLFLCSFIGIDVAKDTLSTLCSKIGAKLKIIVSNQAIDKRFTKQCVEFMRSIFGKLLEKNSKIKGWSTY